MPRKKTAAKDEASTSLVRIPENSRLIQTHESMVDYLNGRTSMNSFMNVFAPNFLGLHFFKPLEDDLIYSDDDDDYDEDYDDCFLRGASDVPLRPHPQIKQLTDEEADKFGKELQDEQRRKDKTEKNKRKKMRKKEKKRQEKETVVQDILPEDERAKSVSSENRTESTRFESSHNTNEPCQDDKSQCAIEEVAGGESRSTDDERKEMKMKEEMNSNFQNSSASAARPLAEETNDQERPGELQIETSTSRKLEEPKEIEVKPDAEKSVVKKEEEPKTSEEKTVNSSEDGLVKKSRDFASMGNRLAASGQYEMAVKYFTDAIKCNPKEFRLFGNRSLCYERIQQYENALRDADVAISMEPSWIKGLFRKGKALSGLKRYYEASLIYQQVLELEGTSNEAKQELKRAQMLHLMELGFSWAQSSKALKTFATLEEAVEALFVGSKHAALYAADAGATGEPSVLQDKDEGDREWHVQHSSRSRTDLIRESGNSRSHSLSPTPRSRNSAKPELFSVWVGLLTPAMTYVRLHELFSRTGTVYSIKMLLDQQCAFVNYTSQEDCERAINCLHGMLVDGVPLTVRHPFKTHTGLSATDPFARTSSYKKECFFWRTSGCTRQDCTFRHVPENKNIDRERFTSRLGCMGNQK